MAVKILTLLNKYFENPRDNRNRKVNLVLLSPSCVYSLLYNTVSTSQVSPTCRNFKHQLIKEPLLLDRHTPPRSEEELRRRGLMEIPSEWQFEPGEDESPFSVMERLKACIITKDLGEGSKLHACIREHKYFESNIYIGSSLVDMYAKCGALTKAHRVLEELTVRNVVSWSALISGYVQNGQGESALRCFDDMVCEGHSPTAVTFASVLQACGFVGAVAKGEEIYEEIVNLDMLEKDIVLGNTLVDMYVKCGALAKAEKVLKVLCIRNTVSWNVLIAGYAQQGKGHEALTCFDAMLLEGHTPTVATFISVLKACGTLGAVIKGNEIHGTIASLGILEKDMVLGSTLVDMYTKCNALSKAQRMLEELPVRHVVSWNALIGGYVQQGQGEEALKCFDDMLREGHTPTVVTYICALKACGSIRAAAKGEDIHDKLANLGMLEKDIAIGNCVVDMYVKCGALFKAHEVLEELPVRNAVSWTALIVGFTQEGKGEEALKFFDDMLCEGYPPTVVSFICVLKACGRIRAAAKGEEIHDKIVSLGMLEKNIMLGNSLVDMYAKCGALFKAQQLLQELPVRDAVTWNALIAGYVEEGQGEEALKCFNDMLHEGHSPTVATFVCILKACGIIEAMIKGEEIHEKVVNLGMLEREVVLGNALVDMYVKCGALAKAQRVLEELCIRDVVTWTTLIAGYARHGQGEEALNCFNDMLCDGHSPTVPTFVCVLKACGSIRAAVTGREIHGKVVSLGMLEKDIVLGNSLVDMYVKCGAFMKAQRILEKLPVRNVVCWSALIAGYAQQGQGEEALKCFNHMLDDVHSPDVVTFISLLKACGCIGAATKGEQIHDKIVNLGILEKEIVLGNTLVGMYAKCGAQIKAQRVLEELSIQNVISWNALISGYAQEGRSVDVLNCFERMRSNGVKPDSITLSSLLHACSHAGLLDQGDIFFSIMSVKYGICPNSDHYCCMTDLFARAGKFNKALSVIAGIPFDKFLTCWIALLGACLRWGDVKTGGLAFEHAVNLDKGSCCLCFYG